jgi:hypothetical protein
MPVPEPVAETMTMTEAGTAALATAKTAHSGASARAAAGASAQPATGSAGDRSPVAMPRLDRAAGLSAHRLCRGLGVYLARGHSLGAGEAGRRGAVSVQAA